MGNRLNVSHGAPQNQASFIVDRGWKSSNSSPLPVEGEVFFLTFPFIDQAIAVMNYGECSGDFAINSFMSALPRQKSQRSPCSEHFFAGSFLEERHCLLSVLMNAIASPEQLAQPKQRCSVAFVNR